MIPRPSHFVICAVNPEAVIAARIFLEWFPFPIDKKVASKLQVPPSSDFSDARRAASLALRQSSVSFLISIFMFQFNENRARIGCYRCRAFFLHAGSVKRSVGHQEAAGN